MTFRIERLAAGENAIVLRVCGRMHIECVNTLQELIEQELIEAENTKIALDLSEITLADSDAATFLAICEIEGIELRNCPAFLRGWVAREQARMGGQK